MGALRTAAAGGDAGRADRLMAWCAGLLRARVWAVTLAEARQLDLPGVDAGDAAEVACGRMPGPLVAAGVVVAPLAAGLEAGPPGLLVAQRDGPAWEPDEVDVLEVVATAVGVMRCVATLTAVAARLRVSALQQLMIADVLSAGRTVEPLVPGLVRAGAGAVAILECPVSEPRAGMAAEAREATDGEGLVVLCPVSRTQVIVLYPAGQRARLEEVIEPVVSGSRRAAGVSTVVPWHSTAAAYLAATGALAEARGVRRRRGVRLRVHDGRVPLRERLGVDARIWASLFLQPLEGLPYRGELLDAAQQTLWWGSEGAVRLVGWSASTLSNRLVEVAEALGLDLADPWHRAVLGLAISLDQLPPPVAVDHSVRLVDVLNHEGAREWAREVLGPVAARRSGPALLETAAAWTRYDRSKKRTARAVGVSEGMVNKRIRQVGGDTHLDLRRPGERLTLALALTIGGHLEMGSLPEPARRIDGPTPRGHQPVTEPREIDMSGPHPARMYDYYLKGQRHGAADREAAGQILQDVPEMAQGAVQNRAVMHRIVRYAVREAGIRQFADIGSGIPTPPNLHEVAQREAPDARVLYVDHDPIVLAHSHALVAAAPPGTVAYAQADMHIGRRLYDLPEARILDLSRPLHLALHAVLHFVSGPERAYGLVRELAAPLAAGSLISITHATADWTPRTNLVIDRYLERGIDACVRTRGEVEQFAAHLGRPAELVEAAPGVRGAVGMAEWRPDGEVPPPPYLCHAVVIRLL